MREAHLKIHRDVQSAGIFALGVGVGLSMHKFTAFLRRSSPGHLIRPNDLGIVTGEQGGYVRLVNKEFKDSTCSDNVIPSGQSRYSHFTALPFCVPVANPVATQLTWIPDPNAPAHRIAVSLPGHPPEPWILPDPQGFRTVTFVPPENPTHTEDAGELWFECQPLPASARLDPYIFQWIDFNEWTGPRPTLKLRCDGVGTLQLIAYLDKPFLITFQKLSELQRATVCTDCNITVIGGGIAGSVSGPDGVLAGMVGAAIGSPDCRECVKDRIEQIAKAAEVAAAVARDQIERAQREREHREAMERSREMDRNNRACEQYERWRNIA